MIIPTMIMGIVALGLLIYGAHSGTHVKGMKIAFNMTVNVCQDNMAWSKTGCTSVSIEAAQSRRSDAASN